MAIIHICPDKYVNCSLSDKYVQAWTDMSSRSGKIQASFTVALMLALLGHCSSSTVSEDGAKLSELFTKIHKGFQGLQPKSEIYVSKTVVILDAIYGLLMISKLNRNGAKQFNFSCRCP